MNEKVFHYTNLYEPQAEPNDRQRNKSESHKERRIWQILEITINELGNALRNLKKNKCAGADNILAEMLQEGGV